MVYRICPCRRSKDQRDHYHRGRRFRRGLRRSDRKKDFRCLFSGIGRICTLDIGNKENYVIMATGNKNTDGWFKIENFQSQAGGER